MATYKRKAGSDLKIDLNVSYSGKQISKSITKTYSEEIIQKKEVDNTDTGVQVVAFNDSSFLASSLKNAKGLLICNEGEVTAEIAMNIASWTHGTPDANASAGGTDLKRVLGAGEFFYMPNLSMLQFSAAQSAALGATLDNAVPDANLYLDSGVDSDDGTGDDITGSATETNLILEQNNSTYYFYVGDLIRVNNEIMEVTAVGDDSDAANTNLTVVRGLYGSTAASDHADDAAIRIPFFNAYYDFDTALSGSSQLIMSDGQGKFKASNFFGKARTSLQYDEGAGLVSGSVALKFYESAYAEVVFAKPITASTDSKITASTAYAFDLTIDDSSATNIAFTTSSSVKFGGSDGIVRLMQDAIDTAFEGTAFGCVVSIVSGALRFTSKSHMQPHDGTNGSLVLVADASSGTDLFTGSVGIMPNDTAFPAPVKAKLPDDSIIDIASGRTTPNVDAFMYDDGHGNLVYQGSIVGTISYTTGAIDFTIPSLPYAQFVLNAAYDSALSGAVIVQAVHADTGISSIFARSTNSKINTTIGVYAFN
jgi:hypothetical protein